MNRKSNSYAYDFAGTFSITSPQSLQNNKNMHEKTSTGTVAFSWHGWQICCLSEQSTMSHWISLYVFVRFEHSRYSLIVLFSNNLSITLFLNSYVKLSFKQSLGWASCSSTPPSWNESARMHILHSGVINSAMRGRTEVFDNHSKYRLSCIWWQR